VVLVKEPVGVFVEDPVELLFAPEAELVDELKELEELEVAWVGLNVSFPTAKPILVA
jgi:hypothetical protein